MDLKDFNKYDNKLRLLTYLCNDVLNEETSKYDDKVKAAIVRQNCIDARMDLRNKIIETTYDRVFR